MKTAWPTKKLSKSLTLEKFAVNEHNLPSTIWNENNKIKLLVDASDMHKKQCIS